MIKKKIIRSTKTTSFLDFNQGNKMHKSIEDTRYVNETKMYAKNNQYKVTADKDNLAYIDSASDMVVIGGDAWVIEEVSNRTATIEGYNKQCIIQ